MPVESITWHVTAVEPNPSSSDAAIQTFVQIWNHATGDDLSVSPRALANRLRFSEVNETQIIVAQQAGQAIAAALVNASLHSKIGSISALAVLPEAQHQGFGTSLLSYAEVLLARAGCTEIRLGDAARLLLLGVPEEAELQHFFQQRGYHPIGQDAFATSTIDHSLNIDTYQSPQSLKEVPAAVRPAQPGQQTVILQLLDSCPTSTHTPTLRKFVENGKRLSDLMLVWREDGLEGLCHLVFEDSPMPIELAFPYRLPRPWAFVPALLVRSTCSPDFAATLLDASLRRLHNNGVNSAVFAPFEPSAWVEPFALIPYRRYSRFIKHL